VAEYGVDTSSPGSPGIGGAIKDAVNAAKSYFGMAGREIQAGREANENKVINGEAGKEDTRIDGHEVEPDGSE
jgi:hypothetical protein